MRKILLVFILCFTMLSGVFAYAPSEKDEKILELFYGKLDAVHEKNPGKIERFAQGLAKIHEKYKHKPRLYYILGELHDYAENLVDSDEDISQLVEDVYTKVESEANGEDESEGVEGSSDDSGDEEQEEGSEEPLPNPPLQGEGTKGKSMSYITDYGNEDDETSFEVDGDIVYMNGVINTQTPDLLEDVFDDHPGIVSLVMQEVPGSDDDEANLEMSLWLAQKDITITLEKDSMIASGGTDFFLSGKHRVMHAGALIGVHSWAGDDDVATDYPEGHAYHEEYIEYYRDIGMTDEAAEDFYYFTINAAPAESIHWMSHAEIVEYGILTVAIILE